MKWLIMLALGAADVLAAITIGSRGTDLSRADYAQWSQLSVMCVIFGPLCVCFAETLGGMEGSWGRGAWMKPTPASLVIVIGWLLLATPLLVVLCLLR